MNHLAQRQYDEPRALVTMKTVFIDDLACAMAVTTTFKGSYGVRKVVIGAVDGHKLEPEVLYSEERKIFPLPGDAHFDGWSNGKTQYKYQNVDWRATP